MSGISGAQQPGVTCQPCETCSSSQAMPSLLQVVAQPVMVRNLTPAPAAIEWQSSSGAVEVTPADAVIPAHQQQAFQVAVWGAAAGQQRAQLQCHLEHGAVQEVAVLATVQGGRLSPPHLNFSQPASTNQGAPRWWPLLSAPVATVHGLDHALVLGHALMLGTGRPWASRRASQLPGWPAPVPLSTSQWPQVLGLL